MKTATGSFLFCGGEIYDHQTQSFKTADLFIENGKIQAVGTIDTDGFQGHIIEIKGKHILPGLIDMHVHLREPGREDEETIVSGAAAAMAGGFTAVCCMPNTSPAIDNRGVVEFVKKQASGLLVDVYPIAAVTKERAGKELTEMADMHEAGAIAFSDDGATVANTQILRYGLEYSRMLDLPIIDHCEDPHLTEGKVMNESAVSTALGFYGVPTVAEDLIVSRDLMMAEYTHGQVHIAHVSSGRAVELIRAAKQRGVHVTAEACPHHFVLTDEAIRSFDPNLRVNPPLRSANDVAALIAGLQDGTIDAIASDHAPHSPEEKEVEFSAAAPGMIGLETALGLVLTHLVDKKMLTLEQLVARMAIAPRRILNLPVPEIKPNETANLTIIDLNQKWQVDKTQFQSKSRNTPFHGWKLTGKALGVFNHGLWFQNSSE